jgi:hypothetical protein
MAPLILSLSTRWRWVASFTLRLPYPPEKNPDIHWKGGWVGLRAGVDVFEKRKSLYPVGIQTPGLSTCSLVTVLTVPLIYNNYPFTWWIIIAFLRLQPQIQRSILLAVKEQGRNLLTCECYAIYCLEAREVRYMMALVICILVFLWSIVQIKHKIQFSSHIL